MSFIRTAPTYLIGGGFGVAGLTVGLPEVAPESVIETTFLEWTVWTVQMGTGEIVNVTGKGALALFGAFVGVVGLAINVASFVARIVRRKD